MNLQKELLTAIQSEDEEFLGLSPEEIEAKKKEKASVIDFKMVTFSLAGKDYAIDIMKVKEIAKAGRFTYVPNTLPFVLGVYNLRGEIIPIIDLRLFFNIDIPKREDNAVENMLILSVGEQTFGVVVDEIDKVVGIQKSTIQPPHPLFGDISVKYIYGVVEANRRLFILLDIDRIFGARNAEEERELAEQARIQMQDPLKDAEFKQPSSVLQEKPSVLKKASLVQKIQPAKKEEVIVEEKKSADLDYSFIVSSLQQFAKFTVNSINEAWAKKRYDEWCKEKGQDKCQLQNEEDAQSFLKPFYSPCTGVWWTKQYADAVYNVLPDNAAKNIVVWNPGCGKGYESYSLACLLKKRYPNARIRIYAHDIDLLSVSNAPLMTLSSSAPDWYKPYLSTTVSGEQTFNKEIKEMVLFEYHDCVNTNALPALDLVFARDVLSFIKEDAQKELLEDFSEKLKGNGIMVLGENEEPLIDGWSKKMTGTIAVYSK